jgi:3-methyladenine DNA glycosylase AlkD
VIAFDWAYRLRRQYALQDFERFERWLETYVNGWGSCDDLCTHALGEHLRRFPESIQAFTPGLPLPTAG